MNAVRPAEIVRRLEQTDAADAELLARFVATTDAAAFAELVRRHGALVLGVCRRVTGHPQDAEDAFQATFLVLAQKAGALRSGVRLWSWLYGVAFRVAWRARRAATRRRAREVTMPRVPEPHAPTRPLGMPELAPILDDELAALPACYRDAIVLCDLRGVSREEAAAALGIPRGTLSSRLANGRKKLAARLTKRGVTLSVAALPLAIAEAQAGAVVPTELISTTCRRVADFAADSDVPASLAGLTEGGFAVRKMLVLGLVMVAAVTGVVLAARPGDDAPPVDPPKPPVVAAKPEADSPPKEEPKPKDRPATFTSAPRKLTAFDLDMKDLSTVRWNATGTRLAVSGAELTANGGKRQRQVVWVIGTGARHERRVLYPEIGASLLGVTPDGSGAVTAVREHHLISGNHQLTLWGDRGEISGPVAAPPPPRDVWIERKTVDLDLPETHGCAFAPDGKTYRTLAYPRGTTNPAAKIEALEVDATTGKAVKSLLKLDYGTNAMSANGKRLAVLAGDKKRVIVYDLDRGAEVSTAELTEPPSDVAALTDWQWVVVFSPDGRRLAVFRGRGRTQLFDADTGAALPALEVPKDAHAAPPPNAFTGDGRLFAAIVTPYKLVTRLSKGPTVKEQATWEMQTKCLTVWDTQTGKALKTWEQSPAVAFNPARPVLAILEQNGTSAIRIGFWDFAAEVEKK